MLPDFFNDMQSAFTFIKTVIDVAKTTADGLISWHNVKNKIGNTRNKAPLIKQLPPMIWKNL